MSDPVGDLPLFAQAPRETGEEALERVSVRIGRAIVEFCQQRVGQTFRADELRAHVELRCGAVAPGSADRVLRELRARNVVAYRVVSRRDSLYLVEGA